MAAVRQWPHINIMVAGFMGVYRLAALLAVSALLVACTTHVTVEPFDLPEARGEKIRASVGLYFPREFTTHPVRERLMEDVEGLAIETDIGPASRSALERTLRSAFDELIVVASVAPDELAEGRIDAVAVPAITRFDYEQCSGTTRVVVGYALALLHRDGRSQTLHVVGRETDEPAGAAGFEFIGSAAPKKIAAAIRDAATALWFRLHAVASEEDWFGALEDNSRQSPAAEPGDAACR